MEKKKYSKIRYISMLAVIAAVIISSAALFSVDAAEQVASSDMLTGVVSETDKAVTPSDNDNMVSLYELIDLSTLPKQVKCEPRELQAVEKYKPFNDNGEPSFLASAAYDGNFRSELDDMGKYIYDCLYQEYAVNKKDKSFNIYLEEYSKIPWPTVSADLSEQEVSNIQEDICDELSDNLTVSFESAASAFIYDNPQIFWIGSIYYWVFYFDYNDDYIFIDSVPVYVHSYYSQAYSQMSAFESGVSSAVSVINAGLPQNATDYQKMKAIHDYISDNAKYDYDALYASDFSPYWYTQTAAPLFVNDPSAFKSGNGYFVCAGYAKSFKILCDRFGLDTCLVVGTSGGGGHMWNYAKADNGIWYAVDTTWDDTDGYGTSYSYFMKGSKVFDARHTPDPYLQGFVLKFQYPPLCVSAYNPQSACSHSFALTAVNVKAASCVNKGYTGDMYCSNCNEMIYVGEELDILPHAYSYVSNNDATCLADGTKTLVCAVCGKRGKTVVDVGSITAHSYTDLIYTDDAYHSRQCVNCGNVIYSCHSGGTASYDVKAVCDYCNHAYGNYLELEIKPQITAITLVAGESFTPDIYRYPADCLGVVGWTSSNSNIATVDSSGRITAVAKGKADITASLHYCTTVIKVNVVVPFKKPTTSVVITKPSITLVTQRSKLSPTMSLSAKVSGTSTGKTWYSDNINVATVTSGGKVTAVSEGTAKIYCRTADGTTSAPCEVKVVPFRIDSDNERKSIVYVNQGKSCKLKLTTWSEHGELTWKSSNPKVAYIDGSGNVTAIKKGTVTITVTAADRTKDTVKLIVVNPSEGVSLKSTTANVYVGKTVSLKALLTTKGSNDPIIWKSSNNATATVTQNGVVKGIRKGSVTITATTFNGKSINAVVVVRNKADSIQFEEVTPALYIGGSTGTFKASITSPADCNDTITWSTSNKNVIAIKSVSADGKTLTIKSVNKGTATITAKTGSGKKVTYKVTAVNQKADSITLNMYSASIYTGKYVILKAKTVTPSGCNDVILWKSSNPDIATVDANGKVTGKAPGNVTIYADSFGGVKNSVQITVLPKK